MPERVFDEDRPAARKREPLLTAIVGPQKSGKTWSALELATGMQRVFGGDIYLIDTESGRGEHYADFFKYRYQAFPPPHDALSYRTLIKRCVDRGAGVVITDSMTHEHSGEGGLLRRIEGYLDRKCGPLDVEDEAELSKREKCRDRRHAMAMIRPKLDRDLLNLYIEQCGSKLNGIFCFRAKPKMKYKAGEAPKELGWQPDTTNPLFYQMTVSFLLPPYSNGVPIWNPEHAAERLYLSLPRQFRGWFKEGTRLSPEVGERFARWATATENDTQTPSNQEADGDETEKLLGKITAYLRLKFPGQTPEDKKARARGLLDLGLGTSSWKEVEALPIEALREAARRMEQNEERK